MIASMCEHGWSGWIPVSKVAYDVLYGVQASVPLSFAIAQQIAVVVEAAECSEDPKAYVPHTNRFMFALEDLESEGVQFCELYAPGRLQLTLKWDLCQHNGFHYHSSMDAAQWALSQMSESDRQVADIFSGLGDDPEITVVDFG